MDQLLIDKFKLGDIPSLPGEECLEALQFLNYLLVRTTDDSEIVEIKVYIEQANQRCKELNLLN